MPGHVCVGMPRRGEDGEAAADERAPKQELPDRWRRRAACNADAFKAGEDCDKGDEECRQDRYPEAGG